MTNFIRILPARYDSTYSIAAAAAAAAKKYYLLLAAAAVVILIYYYFLLITGTDVCILIVGPLTSLGYITF